MSQPTPDETLLGLLAARAQHGYELLDCFHDPNQLGQVWDLSTSQLYAVLKRLEAQGFTEGHIQPAADAPTRIEYTLTAAGQLKLRAWLNEAHPSPSIRRVRVEFLSRLYIARLLDVPVAPIIDRQKEACSTKRTELNTELNAMTPGVGRLALELIIDQFDVILRWLDRCEETLQSIRDR